MVGATLESNKFVMKTQNSSVKLIKTTNIQILMSYGKDCYIYCSDIKGFICPKSVHG